jgi:hypothetical protein
MKAGGVLSLFFSTLKMEAICSSKTSVDTKWTTQHYIPEDGTLHNYHCENLKSFIYLYNHEQWSLTTDCSFIHSVCSFEFLLIMSITYQWIPAHEFNVFWYEKSSDNYFIYNWFQMHLLSVHCILVQCCLRSKANLNSSYSFSFYSQENTAALF